MTDKQIIKLKPKEDLNEKIIKEKGNTKCIFYADDICRNGDKTRDCVNCARVEYHSLYYLNWDNQERLQKIIKHKEQECEELKEQLTILDDEDVVVEITVKQFEEYKKLKAENEELKEDYATAKSMYDLCQSDFMELAKIKDKYKQTLAEIKEICNKTVCDYLQCSLNYNHSKDFECEKTSCNRAKRRKFILEILQKINEVKDEHKRKN